MHDDWRNSGLVFMQAQPTVSAYCYVDRRAAPIGKPVELGGSVVTESRARAGPPCCRPEPGQPGWRAREAGVAATIEPLPATRIQADFDLPCSESGHRRLPGGDYAMLLTQQPLQVPREPLGHDPNDGLTDGGCACRGGQLWTARPAGKGLWIAEVTLSVSYAADGQPSSPIRPARALQPGLS